MRFLLMESIVLFAVGMSARPFRPLVGSSVVIFCLAMVYHFKENYK